jgi:hypothetical protein
VKIKSLLLLAVLLSACAQHPARNQPASLLDDQVKLTFTYKPDAVYRLETRAYSNVEMRMTRDSAGLPAALPPPRKINAREERVQKITTGTPDRRGGYPVDQYIFKQRKYISINGGVEQEQPEGNKFEGMLIRGRILPGGAMEYVSAEGAGSSPVFQQVMKSVFDQLRQAQLAGQVVRVGETISVKTPMTLPNVAGMMVNADSETTYTLKEIKNGIAFFDLGFSLSMNASSAVENSTATGSGTGTMTYDIGASYSPAMTMDMTMSLDIPIKDGGILKNHSVVKSETTTTYDLK